MNDDIVVSVLCITYNQEKYIGKAIESFINQKTDFKYEILINDDASTDKTAEIIKEYQKMHPDKIRAFIQTENLFSRGINPTDVIYRQSKGKYIAMCEGDDFWVDCNKLKKQIDFLEKNEDYALCTHAAYMAKESGKYSEKLVIRPFTYSGEITTEQVLERWLFPTCSLVYRKSCRPEIENPYRGDCRSGDFALTTYIALHGKVYYMDELMGAYRYQSVGSITWGRKKNISNVINDNNKYIAMLDRLDRYTNELYHDIIERNKDNSKFEIYYLTGNTKELVHTNKYYQNNMFKKMLLVLKSKLHGIIYRKNK